MRGRERVAIIIPAYNEEEHIAATLKSLAGLKAPADIIVVDDGSRDGTADAARAAGARVIELPANRGKGGALQIGLEQTDHPVVAFLDADLGSTACQVQELLLPVLQGEADLAIARWPQVPGGSGFGLAQGLARWGIRRLTGFSSHSPLSGQRAVRRSFLPPLEGGFGVEVAMTVDCLWRGARVLEVPVAMRHRVTGRDLGGFRHRGRQFCWVVRTLAARGGFSWK